eukprot:7731614-Alexandrium_andersonii.AAC.1
MVAQSELFRAGGLCSAADSMDDVGSSEGRDVPSPGSDVGALVSISTLRGAPTTPRDVLPAAPGAGAMGVGAASHGASG